MAIVLIASSTKLENTELVRLEKTKSYQVLWLNGNGYFAVHGNISEYEWDYYYLISYEGIAKQLAGIKWICFVGEVYSEWVHVTPQQERIYFLESCKFSTHN